MQGLNIRQRKFVRGITKKGLPASVAYAAAYGGKASDPNVQSMASRLSSNVKVKKTLEQVETELADDAVWAYEMYKELLIDPKTPNAIKEKMLAHIMVIGGLRPTQQIDIKDNRVFKGLNDDTAWLETVLKDIKARKESK